MPELPEAERARQTLETILGREIAAVHDEDSYVCRPHPPGEIASALCGHTFTSAQRRGKFLWLVTDDGPTLGLHLGMAGHIVVGDDDGAERLRSDRFSVDFADGTRMTLRDRRRLGRAVLNPDHGHIGPDAGTIGRDEFRERIGRGHTAVKARLLNQGAISGVGNLLADDLLWRARIAPAHDTGSLTDEELDRLRREMRAAIREALRKGGVHTAPFIQARRAPPRSCPRDGGSLQQAKVGGRTTWWCPACQT